LGDLLFDDDMRIRSEAAWALEKHGDPALVSKLLSAIRSMQQERVGGAHRLDSRSMSCSRGTAEFSMLSALWVTSPTEASAQAIIDLARICDDHGLYVFLDNPIGRALMTDEEWLALILKYKLQMALGGPGALDFSLSHNDFLVLDAGERAVMDRHRADILPQMRTELAESGGCVPAMVLGYFKDAESLPHLRRLFLGTAEFYGWEGSFPDILAYNQYPLHHCYEEAIEAIAGKSLEEYIVLSEGEKEELQARYRKGEEAALYALSRLDPETASKELSSEFKAKEDAQRYTAAYLLALHFLEKGMGEEGVRNILGRPNASEAQVWTYEIGENLPQRSCVLRLFFSGRKLSDWRIALRHDRDLPQ